jgi:CobQ-like glutamine amidotransferase family enzyme
MAEDTSTLGKYKSLMKLYEYKAKSPWVFDLTAAEAAKQDITFDSFITFLSKGDKYIMVADSHGYITTFKGRGEKVSGFEKKNRIFTGFKGPILSMNRHLSSVLFV